MQGDRVGAQGVWGRAAKIRCTHAGTQDGSTFKNERGRMYIHNLILMVGLCSTKVSNSMKWHIFNGRITKKGNLHFLLDKMNTIYGIKEVVYVLLKRFAFQLKSYILAFSTKKKVENFKSDKFLCVRKYINTF